MLRSKWKGTLTLGLVSIPVKLYKATDSQATVSFHQVHDACGERIEHQKWCTACNKRVDQANVRRAHDVGGILVQITPEEIATVQVEANKTIAISRIVPAAHVSPLMIEQTDYLAPDGKAARLAFSVILAALEGHLAIGTIVQRDRESIVAVGPYVDAKGRVSMILHHLYFASELRGLDQIADLADVPSPPAAELGMARQLLAGYRGDFDATRYTDTYTVALRKMIADKAAGKLPAPAPAAIPAPAAVDLMAALRASVAQVLPSPTPAKAAVKPAAAAARKPAARRRA
jgi:DNA end-binding protein Ku